MPLFDGIHHVAIIVSDYKASREFYVDKLGFEVVRENYRADRGDWKLDLRIGTILAAEQHPNADKLLRFDVDLGEEKPRQIVSGIAAHFKPEDLVGRKVVVVANLPPRKLRGLESQGMILTAEFDGGLSLLTADAPSGSSIA